MQNQMFQLLGSYDLFGKAIPGAILLAGALSFLPAKDLPLQEISSLSFLNIAALIIILLIVGLTIGQGIHTLADNFEKTFLWFAKRLRGFLNYIRVITNQPNLNLSAIKSDRDLEGSSLKKRIAQKWWNGVIEWLRRRYWGGYDSLVGHRYLFGKWIEWNYSPENNDRWKTESKGIVFDRFVREYERVYKSDVRKKDPHQIASLYPLLTSVLEGENSTQFRHFQALYSFCRSMWVVSFLLTTGYLVFLIDFDMLPDAFLHQPAIFELTPARFHLLIPTITILGTLIFFDASGTYKRHFVEYFMASFSNTLAEVEPEQRDAATSSQLTFDQIEP